MKIDPDFQKEVQECIKGVDGLAAEPHRRGPVKTNPIQYSGVHWIGSYDTC